MYSHMLGITSSMWPIFTRMSAVPATGLINAIKAIFKEEITGLQAKTLLDTSKGDINIIKKKYEIAEIQGGVTGIVGWMIDAIKKDYPAPKGKTKVDTFNGYEQRNYNFDTLEKMATGQVNYEESREDLYK